MLKIAVVSVNFNGEKDTLELLNSLEQLSPHSFQLKTIIVDNGSSDNFVEAASKKYPEVDILQNGVNKGFSGGYNRCIEHALIWGADYVLIINNDALTPDEQAPSFGSKSLLTTLLQTFEKHPEAGIVSPKIYFAPGYEFHKDRYKKEDEGKVVWFAGGKFDWENVMSIHRGIDEVDNGTYDGEMEMDFATGCCFLIKREVLEKVGLFNEDYFAYFEDSEFSKRVLDAGFKIYYNGDASIYHKVSQTTEIGSFLTDYYLTRNRLMFGFRYASKRTKFALWRQAISQLIFGRPAQMKAVKDFFAGKKGPEKPQKWNDEAKFQKQVSIVSSNYNTAPLFRDLIKSILDPKSGYDPQTMEIIMLDDCSPTDPEPEIKQFFSKIRFYRNETNKGFTRSFNRLMKFSRGKYILVLNSDIGVLENGITELIKAEDKLKGEVVLGGRLYFPDMRSQDSVYYLPSIWGAIKEYLFNIQGAYFMFVPKAETHTKVEAIVGACMFIPRKVIEKVGFLSEEMVSYFEDHEYCRRLNQNNVPIYFVPGAKFIHHHGATFKTLGAKSLAVHRSSAIVYYGRFYFTLSYIVLLFLQKLTGKRPPGSMEPSVEKTNIIQKIKNLIRNLSS